MNHYFIFFILILLTASCGNKNPDHTDQSSVVEEEHCYRYVTHRDTVVLKLKVTGQSVSGALTYNYFGKDKNEGSISGELKGDTLFAEYIFFSEGSISTRDVIFLKKDESLVEGYGEMEERNGKLVFKDGIQPDFNNSVILQRMICNELKP